MVGVIFLVLRYRFSESTSKEIQLLVYGIIWFIVLSVSIICCCIYIKLIYNFRLALLFEQCQRSGTIFVLQLMVAMLCLGLLSTYTLLQLVQRVDAQVKNMEFSSMWKGFFYITAFFRIFQRLLASEFMVHSVARLSGNVEEIVLHYSVDNKLHQVCTYRTCIVVLAS